MLPILFWCLLAPQAECLEAFMPDNTALVVSLNPKVLVEVPAFETLRGRLSNFTGDLEKALTRLEKVARLEDIHEITVIVPLDAQLRNNFRVLVRGDLDISNLMSLAMDRGISDTEEFKNGAFMVKMESYTSYGLGILPDGSLVVAEPRVLAKNLKKLHSAEKGRFDPGFRSMLSGAELGGALWGACSLPQPLAVAMEHSLDLPFSQVEGIRFHLTAFTEFQCHLFLKLKPGTDPEIFAEKTEAIIPVPDASKGKARKKAKHAKRGGPSEELSSLLQDLAVDTVKDGVKIRFNLKAENLAAFLAKNLEKKGMGKK